MTREGSLAKREHARIDLHAAAQHFLTSRTVRVPSSAPALALLASAAAAGFFRGTASKAHRCLCESWRQRLPTYQHIGSRFTQVGDEDLVRLDLLSFGQNTIGRPLTANVFTYDPRLPAYDIVNLRAGVRRNRGDIAAYVNNVTDERALLSLDQERGTRARIGYLTNQPRTFGVATRLNF